MARRPTKPRPRPIAVVVDDAAEVAQLFGAVLREAGFSVSLAYDGDAGLYKAKKRAPDIVVCPELLFRRSGPDLIRTLRARPRARRPKFIIATGLTVGEPTSTLGADAVLFKPVSPSDLRATAQRLVGRP